MKPPKLYATALRRYNRSRGFGVHSPFAYGFIRDTLGERNAYYAYPTLAERRRMARALIKSAGRNTPRLISIKNARMLFRVACRFHPDEIFQIGTRFGMGTSAVLAANSHSHLTLFSPADDFYNIFEKVTLPDSGRIRRVDSFSEGFSAYMESSERMFLLIDCLDRADAHEITRLLTQALSERECVIIVRNLTRPSDCTRPLWDALKSSMTRGMTFTNGNIGFIVTRKGLPRQHFTLWF